MKVTLKTEVLKELVSKAMKGVGNNKFIPITSFIELAVDEGEFSLTTTDATNYLYVKTDKLVNYDLPFTAVIEADQFGKLISKLTTDETTITVKKSEFKVEVESNGKYTIPMPIDENGGAIKFPNLRAQVENVAFTQYEISPVIVNSILSTAKSALAVTLEVPVYTGYYCKDKIIATDTYKICSIDVPMFADKALLISSELMDLVGVLGGDKIEVSVYENGSIVFVSIDGFVYGKLMSDVDDYAIDAIEGLLNQDFMHVCKIKKVALLSTLDRIALFVDRYDNKEIALTFTETSLDIKSKQSNGVESVQYTEHNKDGLFMCLIDIDMFTQQVKASSSDVLEIHYGLENSIQLVDGNITQVIALLENN